MLFLGAWGSLRSLVPVVWNTRMVALSSHSHLVLPWLLSVLEKSLTPVPYKEDVHYYKACGKWEYGS